MRRGSIVQLVLLGVLFGAGAAAVALLIPWLPPVASRQRERIDLVFWFATVICIGIFTIVAAVIAYSVLKFRARPDDDSDGPPIHGHTGLEIAWTAVPAILVTAIGILSAVVLAQNGRAGANHMTVRVTARQFAWSFEYLSGPAKGITSSTLYLPRKTPVELQLNSLDVIHSFWVPQFGQKQDALPNPLDANGKPKRFQKLVITPTKTGTFPVICTELCGLGHALMRSRSVVMQPAAFAAWARRTQQGLARPGASAGETVFSQNGCGSCHTLKAARATGKVGPDLDQLPALAKKAGKPLDAFVRESIVDPDAYVAPGFPKNVMPKTYSQLPDAQLRALVQYLIESSEAAK